ncbi:hypothetical protein CWI75_06710 [Kineobactrum sediminis]|uniref:TonB C-terminal domain-containing protein n=1 Tax=Kineobactrum sediminis TaxID=1905677 RepID=A0A2N5Y3Y4_9GAMM|nr:hypothetical protein [Kineobactrum sediminis]PLW83106.1 hypothetical protein CWI75_06710 [Kineobactrum sediminis]
MVSIEHCSPARWLLLALMALAAPAVIANQAASYGSNFVRLDKQWPDEAPPVVPIASLPADTGGHRVRRQQVEQLELDQGPYAATLAEPLMELARWYFASGDPDAAGSLYRQALHVLRINEGLESERQLPLLEGLLAVQRSLGDWHGLDERYEYYYRFARVNDPEGVEVALEYFRWQREALRRQLDSTPHRRLLQLYEENQSYLEHPGKSLSPALHWRLLDSQLRNLYLLQAQVKPQPKPVIRARPSPFFNDQPQDMDVYQQRLMNLQRNAVGLGSAMLEGFLTSGQAQEAALRGQVLLALADWHHWNGSRPVAGAGYADVVAHLQRSGQADKLQQWFGQPVELPDNGVFWRDAGNGGIAITARFEVSEEGRVRDVSTVAEDEQYQGFAIRLYRRLLATRFRPQFAAGEAVQVANLERRYRYLDPAALRRFRSP